MNSDWQLDWANKENFYFLNPRMPADQTQRQLNLLKQFLNHFSGHLFLLSSGTTSDHQSRCLKWVALSKEAFLSSAESVNHILESNHRDVWLNLLPGFHVGGLAIYARSSISGAKVLSMASWDVNEFIREVTESQVTLTSLVPTQIYDLVREQRVCPPSVRAVLVGGGALAPSLYQKAKTLGWPVLITYGMTETASASAILDGRRVGTELSGHWVNSGGYQFQVLPHLEMQVDVLCCFQGCLMIRGKSLFTAYLTEGEKGEGQIQDPKEAGWFRTSDRGELRGSSLRLLGRAGDFVKIGGESVEMSRLNLILDDVKDQLSVMHDLALIPYPDERLGHVIYLLSDPHLSSSQAVLLREAFAARVLPFEKIREWKVLDPIPRTALGKLKVAACVESILGLFQRP